MPELDNIAEVEEAETLAPQEDPTSSDELIALREKVKELSAQLREREEIDAANARMKEELEEFYEYFPSVDPKSVPDEVWERVKCGASLAATYSLFERKREREAQRTISHNERMRRMSAGALEAADSDGYYSPDEVRRMTPAQVRKNYDDIVESMRHWN